MIFFFKQKTAYEITVRLEFRRVLFRSRAVGRVRGEIIAAVIALLHAGPRGVEPTAHHVPGGVVHRIELQGEIGRASCRERVEMSVVAGSLKKNREVVVEGDEQLS